jgi:hypothetical protein
MSARLVRISILAVSIASVAAVAAAHHSFAAFDMTQEKTVSGVVQKVEWTNPHIWIYMDVPGQNGTTERYAFEGMTPNYLNRRGWTRQTVQSGMAFTVTFRPMRDGKSGGMFVTGKLANGKSLSMRGGESGQ